MTESYDNNNSLDKTQEIKKDFYRFRNGIVADALKKIYPTGKLIYGLTVPQFMEIARKYPKDLNTGLKLWQDKKVRESRLLALYLIPPVELSKEVAKDMLFDVDSTEEAEFLAFRILRFLPMAKELLKELNEEKLPTTEAEYCLSMFKKNLSLNSDSLQ